MAHLFDKLNPNFFSILSSPNKRMYVDCLFIIYNAVDSIEESFQGDREYVVSRLVDYFDDIALEEFVDVTENNKPNTSRQKANYVINVLKNNGWIGEEELGDYKISLNLFDYSIKTISLLDDIVNARQDEYTGEIFAVYSLLNSFTIEEGIGVIEQSYKKTLEIIKKLKALKANIYRYYYDITKKRSKENLQNILEKLLIEYKQNFFDTSYYNLKTKDSLPRYKRAILKRVSVIYDNVETMDILASKVIQDKRIDDYNEAFSYIENKLRFIQDSFNVLDNLIIDIDRKNEQYISATASKILYLTNHSDDIEGIFNRLFKVVLSDDDFDFNSILNVAQIKNLDTASLYNQRRYRMDSIPEELFDTEDFFTEEDKERRIQKILENSIYSKREINKYVLELLRDRRSLKASEIIVNSKEEYIKLVLIFLYSKSVGMEYDIELLNNEVVSNFVSFNDFKIFHKGVSYE
ncbi:Wadjet anti-phage system protein JetA family protein [Haploplasma modicum]|uniref:Wadjet anti-phage system protein JetA family protein n=1 Tax=Haploplasma modicum TaxID=2150 RepID=UPI0004786E79|nr:Wadjet anti-phage system protein JetA family protein [Haploplasma modicum]